ncbi:MAG: hypothetical protein HFJ48_08090 [Clostridia bacterium]|nr:hypothetical protein [Clostridia bacterium]
MENENVQPNQTPNSSNGSNGNNIFSTITNFVKSNTRLVLIAVAILLVLIILIAIISNVAGGPKQAVKNYVSAMNKMDANKILSTMDVKASIAYYTCYAQSSDFDESDFKKEYKKVKNSDVKDFKESFTSTLDRTLDVLKDNDYSYKLISIKDVEEFKNCKNLYNVEAKIRMRYKDDDGDKQDITNTINLIVYKNKIVSVDLSSLLD